jgi:carbonic anhydrase
MNQLSKHAVKALYLLTFSFVMTSCAKDIEVDDCQSPSHKWTYDGKEGVNSWSICYSECAGSKQSPLDIKDATVQAGLSQLQFSLKESPVSITYNGHTLEQEWVPGSKLTIGSNTFELDQFHFHTRSEHTISGKRYPMEIHFVHKQSTSNAIAVVGVMVEAGAENPMIKLLSIDLPMEVDEEYKSNAPVLLSGLMPANKGYFYYPGSLTTPPCSEVVSWYVLKTPIQASSKQINAIQQIISENNRPAQALAGRTIVSTQD